MLPVERVIGEEGLSATPNGLRLAMRLPWYRSLPFSTVEVASLAIDDAPVDLGAARVVRDSAFLLLPGQTATPGSEHRVALTVNVNPPYIPGMKRANPQTAALRVN
jgi:hypothetical protein